MEVYAPGDETELFLNGVSLGRKPAGEAAEFRTLYETVYEPGELLAVAYQGGEKIGEYRLLTADTDLSLKVEAEKTWGSTDENPIRYIDIYVTDGNGTVYDAAEQKLTASVRGGEILGFGSGDPKTSYGYQTDVTETWLGHALLIVRKDTADAETEVTIESAVGTEQIALA